LWFIPLFIKSDAGEQYFELTEATSRIKVKINNYDSYLKLNYKGKSFLRVNYGEESSKRVFAAASSGLLSASDNATLLSDASSLMKSGKVSLAD